MDILSASATTDDKFPTMAGNLYARWTLDCLAEIAYAISADAIYRPQVYQSDDIPDELVNLRMSYGTAPHLPNSSQRQAMMIPILGPSDGLRTAASSQSSFQMARRKFFEACAGFARHASDVERSILEDQVRFSAAILRAHFEGIRGKSFRLSTQQINDLFEIALRTLKAPGVTKVFGIGHIAPEWPFNSMDSNGAKLVESVGIALSLSGNCKLTFTDFLLLQRIAREGSQAIHVLLSVDLLSDEELKSLIKRGYTWHASLREVPGGSAAAVAQSQMNNPQRAPLPQSQTNPQRAILPQPQMNPQRATLPRPQVPPR
jgi:hypothetical protein